MNPHGTLETGRATSRRGCELSNGGYTVQLTAAGTGGSSWQDLALTAWARDPVEDMGGFFLYLRDHDSGATWSAGQRPARRRPDRYEAFWNHERFTIERLDVGIAARLEVVVAPDAPVEIRRLTLENRSRRPRLIEVTSYAEVVLQDAAAFFAHPEFSRLFIQTEYEDGVLLAHRRPRGAGERTPWLWHALAEVATLEHETDRRRFIGRGHDLSAPRALADGAPLSGTTGNVLDPILSLRRRVELDTAATVSVTFLLGVAPDRAAALAEAARWAAGSEAAEVIDRTSAARAASIALEGKARVIPARGSRPERAKPLFTEPLRHFNGIGGFNADGTEYVIRLQHHEHEGLALPPRPWINVLANEHFGCLVSETGAGATWCGNSREHRLTPWSNDPLLDPHGEAFYLVDRDTGEAWSPLPGPRPAAANYEMRHGFGYSRCRHMSHGLEQEASVFVARHDPVKVVWLRLINSGPARRLSFLGYQRLVLGARPEVEARKITTEIDSRERMVLARNPSAGESSGRVAFAAPVFADDVAVRFTCDREAFLGADGSVREPEALRSGVTEGRDGAGFDPCFAQELELTVPAGAVVECAILLGEGADATEARRLIARYREPRALERALEAVQGFWGELLSRVHVQTPCSALDVLVNGWLGYQALACRMWGRTAFQQSGGAFGFRDQLQDAAAMAWFEPDLLREQIRLHAAHQFVEGDVLHWWHPEARGIRTRFADDLLWLPWAVAAHVAATGDRAMLDEEISFVDARRLEAGEDEAYLQARDAGRSASLYEHCCLALDRALATGAHGLPFFGTGDWNDGMNRVGREGRGESAWMGFFLYAVLGDFVPLCEARDDSARALRYRQHRDRLRAALDTHAWDGDWYLRGFYDDGAPLGSARSDECRIDALVQAWSVISDAAPRDKAEKALAAVQQRLVSERDGILRLLDPPFEHTPSDPGYIKGYVPGVRENGGQYTHAAMWVVRALAQLGARDRAARLLEMLSPVSHTRSPEQVARYGGEPYVVAADVYGVAPHVGRCGWTWYTGSAGWMLRVMLESILGLGIEQGKTLVLKPCLPVDWPEARITLRIPGRDATYDIHFLQPAFGNGQLLDAQVDRVSVSIVDGTARIPLAANGTHTVTVMLG
jgi:cyclic beta-1,2-glucan synthetase